MSRKIILYMMFIFILIFSFSCDREGENIPTQALTVDMYLANGWEAYEAGLFDDAVDAFTSAKERDAVKLEAYNGLGWSLAQVADYENSISSFKFLLSMTDDPQLIGDCYAGLSMTYAAYRELPAADGNPDTIAIEYAETGLQHDPDYVFAHDEKVNAAALHLIIAQSHYNSENFLIALTEVDSYVEPDFEQSLIDDGTILKVEDDTVKVVVSASTEFNGTVSFNLEGKELVNVLSIVNPVTDISYNVVSFDEGGMEVSCVGNPVPKDEDIFLVDYLHAPNYGIFLSKLLEAIERNRP